MQKLFFILFVFSLLSMGCKSTVTDIYIANGDIDVGQIKGKAVLNTIEEGIEKVTELRKKGNRNSITLHMTAGAHELSSPILISESLGPLKLVGEGSDKTVIKGSYQLNIKWKKYNDNIWVAQMGESDNFDQILINGKQQVLARYPNYDENGGHWQGHASDAILPERVETWKNPKNAYVHAMHKGEWGGFHYKVTGKDKNNILVLTGGHQNNRPSEMHETYRMVENVFEELDSPGEWFLNKNNLLFYWPLPGLDLKNAVVEGVRQKHCIEIVGTEERPVTNIVIDGIRFEHTQRTFMEEYEPLLRSDWAIYRGGAIFLEGTENIDIQNCEFTNLGGNAIFVSGYNRNVQIRNNHIHDCGASAISFVGRPSAVRSPSFQYSEFVPLTDMDTIKGPKTNSYPSNSIVDNNLIYRIGRVEKQTAGVEIAMAMNITVSNNSIYDVPRAGINIGDGTWGGHIIEYNDVFNTVLESGDHGAFNSWGRDRFWHPNRNEMNKIVIENPEMPKWDAIHTTVIRNNRFRCDHGWDIDLDDGSSNYHIYNNLCLNGGIKLREGFYRTVENNITINNGFHPHVWFKNSNDVFRRNIVFTEHKDIRVQDWGKEVDYNIFPDKSSLSMAQEKGVDKNSMFGDVLFVDSSSGNYNLKEGSVALKIGFQPFNINEFGVKSEKLKTKAKTPEIPILYFGANIEKSIRVNWLGAKIKNVESMAERSASGLSKTAGVLIISMIDGGVLGKSGIQVGDVIISSESEEVNSISDLMKSYQNHNWKGKMSVLIVRNQNKEIITITTK